MTHSFKNCDIVIEGQALVRIRDDRVYVEGRDFHGDLKNLSSIIHMLSDIVESAQASARPRVLTAAPVQRAAAIAIR